MATDVAVLIARLEADVKDFDKDLKKASKRLGKLEDSTKKTGKATDTMKGSMAGLGKMMGVVFAGAAAAAAFKFFKGAVDASSDLNESINAVNVVFEESAEGVKKLGENAADSMGLANSEFNTLAVSFSSFVEKIVGPGGDVVKTLEDLTTRAADFASVMNIDVAEAATIFRSGLAGETEPLRKFGLDLSAAAVTAEALAVGLAETSSELTEQDKILARYNLLMRQTKKTQGDFKNTADDFANAMRILSAKIEDVKAKIGDALIPVLEEFIPLISDFVDFIAEAAIAFGVFTGATDLATAAIFRAKNAAEDTEAPMTTLFEAVMNLDDSMVGADSATFGVGLFRAGKEARLLSDEMFTLDGAFVDLIETFGITTKELESLGTDGFIQLATDAGLSEELIQAIIRALELDLRRATNAAKRHLKDNLEEGLNKAREATEEADEALEDYMDRMLELASPALAAFNAQQDLEEATVDAAAAFVEFTPDSDEYAEALLRVWEAGLKVAATEAVLDDKLAGVEESLRAAKREGFLTEAQFLTLQELFLNFTDEPLWSPAQIINAIAMKDAIEGINRAIRAVEELGPIAAVDRGNISPFHQGGIVPGPAGADVPIIAQAGEQIIPAAQVSGGGGGGGVTINIDGDGTEAVLEDIQRELLLESIGRLVETR